jgi:tetratricopeptide (TPR) repeat protein
MPAAAAKTVLIMLWVLLLGPAPARSAAQQPAPVVEIQRVTAFDLLVELTRPKKPLKSVEAPADLALDDFTVLWDGASLPLVDLATGAEDREPWRLVVYIDRVLSSNHTVRWAAMELAERARRLTELGEVEIVVAEPEPRRVLAPTRDTELIDGSLSGVFLAPAGTVELVSRREEFLIAYPDGPHDPVATEIARRADRDERLLLRRQMDRLLGWIVDSEPPTSRRAVLLVGDGWDLDPGKFYAGPGAAPPVGPPHSDLHHDTRELAETLAAYGWIVAPLAPPAPPVGAGRFGAFVLPDVTFPWLFAVKLRSLEVSELGNSLRAQGLLDRAVETYKKAVYHYYDHPKTAKRQAVALVALGETLELQQKGTAARAAFRTATVFNPALQARFPFAAARLLAPHEPLEALAELTTGNLAADPDTLDHLLLSLAQRLRLTAQLPGIPDDALHQLDVRLHRSGFEHRFAPVARWGTPPAIAELRLRRLLDGEPTIGELELTASLTEEPATHGGPVEVELQLTAGAAPRRAPLGRPAFWSHGPAPDPRQRSITARAPRRCHAPAAPRCRSTCPPAISGWRCW